MVLSMAKWKGKVAVVTGASSGIGAATVDRLVQEGLIVVGIARRVELIEQRPKSSPSGGQLHAIKADITKEDELLKAFQWVEENLGPMHILINNAAVAIRGGLTDSSTENLKKVFDLNVLALCVATREATRVMKKNNINGHIIHVNSVVGHQVLTHQMNVYPASKFAVTALTETLRQELNSLGLKIKITSLSPGLVATEATTLNKNNTPEIKAWFEGSPILQPEDIADGIVYVLSTPEHVQVHELTIRPL